MKPVKIVRRRKLGLTSCREIARFIRNHGGQARAIRNWKAGEMAMIDPDDLVVRWGCTSNINSKNVLNSADAIHQVNNKMAFRKALNEDELCPRTFFEDTDPVEKDDIEFPLVVRPAHHSRGRNLHVVNTARDFNRVVQRLGPNNWYASELINKSREFRVFVVQGLAVAVAEKTPGNPQDVAWNVARGGRFDNVRWGDWPLKTVSLAIQAFQLTDLDFGGVDVMEDQNGEPYIIEINSAPSLTSPYRQEAFGKAIHHMAENGKDRLPLRVEHQENNWRHYVHPAIWSPKGK